MLYLYENLIEEIQNLEFAKNLSYLYLQNNRIAAVPEIAIPKLKKLYLDENHIDYVAGFEGCPQLEELSLARQNLPKNGSLLMEPTAMHSLASTLLSLDISGNGLVSFAPFAGLYSLRKIFAQSNKVGDLGEVEALISLPRIEEADFKENPCTLIPRYRDYAVAAAGDFLTILDEVNPEQP